MNKHKHNCLFLIYIQINLIELFICFNIFNGYYMDDNVCFNSRIVFDFNYTYLSNINIVISVSK